MEVNNTNHPPMPLSERAKIFMPFDPLKGFKEALAQKEEEILLAVEQEHSESIEDILMPPPALDDEPA